jgi:lipoprotein NlpI
MTVLPFFDMIDYRQFIVVVQEYDIFRLEQVLLSFSLEQKQRMQTALLRVRGMFLYGSGGTEQELARIHQSIAQGLDANDISPVDMILSNIALRHLTDFPSEKS